MDSIILKRNWQPFYLTLPITLVMLGCFTALAYIHIDPGMLRHGRDMSFNDYRMAAVGIIADLLTLYFYYTSFFIKVPVIYADREKIKFGRRAYYWKDVVSIVLIGKVPFKTYRKILWVEGLSLTFTNEQKKYIVDSSYKNAWQIKQFIQQVVIDKSDTFELSNKATTVDTNFKVDDFRTFNGSLFTSSGFIYNASVGLVGCVYLFFKYRGSLKTDFVRAPLIIDFLLGFYLLFFLALFTLVMHYFRVSSSLLIVRNNVLYWRKYVYCLTDILEIVINKEKKTLTIITKDMKSKVFLAHTLSDKTWLALEEEFGRYGVAVRDKNV